MDKSSKEQNFEFLLENSSTNSKEMAARVGRLAMKGRQALETPNFLAITSRGVVPHVAPDMMRADFAPKGVYLALEDFIEKKTKKTAAPVFNAPAGSKTPLQAFTALPSKTATVLAPRRSPAVTSPQGNADNGISIFTSTGFATLEIVDYIKYAIKLQPDIVVAVGDIPHSGRPGIKRAIKMEDRTSKWLTNLLEDLKRFEAELGTPQPAVFAPILPADASSQPEYLTMLSEDFADRLSGLAFYKSDVLPDIPATSRLSSLPRLSLDVPTSPHQVLQQISLGMDVFTLPFINAVSDAGISLVFEFPRPAAEPAASAVEGTSVLPLGIDLRGEEHATSMTPLIPGCACYTCTYHSRAYVRHLLNAKEMLAWTLLQIHNHACVSDFFAAIRGSIQRGTFDEDNKTFAETYDSELPAGTGQGPRQRGYHAKSEGGEPKRNKPAWGALDRAVEPAAA